MGRPTKQKEAVTKYFKKSLQKKGKSEYFDCIFCLQSFAYNSWRMAKHLITCTKTTATFKNSDLPIIQKLFSNNNKNNNKKEIDLSLLNDDETMFIIDNENLTTENTSRSNTSLSNYSESSLSKSVGSSKLMNLDRFVDRIINNNEKVTKKC